MGTLTQARVCLPCIVGNPCQVCHILSFGEGTEQGIWYDVVRKPYIREMEPTHLGCLQHQSPHTIGYLPI